MFWANLWWIDVYKRQGVDSYNVSVAAGIILYEIQSQRAAQQA